MVARKAVPAALGLMAAAFMAYPYVTLYRLDRALQRGDTAALAADIDWDRVREGIKEDICDEITGVQSPPIQQASHSADLPDFGASFVSGMASNAVDEEVTPERLTATARAMETLRNGRPPATLGGLKWAFFTGLTSFEADLSPPGETIGQPPIRLRLDLAGGRWIVTRAWLPAQLLEQSQAHT